MTQDAKHEFGKWRMFFWPIHAFELKKLLPMFFMFFCISFNYTILRDTKDVLIVTAAGAEAIPFLKLWAVVPAAIIFMLVYSKLSNILSKENLFYVTIIPFLIFFALFAMFLYPSREVLMPNEFADYLKGVLPSGWGGFVEAMRNWSFSLFYVAAELWGSVALSLLFWGFANQITKVSEAKRFYNLFGLGANLALIFSGPAIVYVSNIRSKLPPDVDAWQVSLNYLMTMVVIAGIFIVGIYWWINRNILTDPRFYDPTEEKAPKKSKSKMSLVDSFRYLLSSKYILCLAILVISYGVAINLVEVTWKNKVKEQFTNYNDYSTFMGYFSTVTGIVTIFMMLIGGGNLIRRKGWGFAALITPIVLLVTGIGFFSFIIFSNNLQGMIAFFGTTPLFLAVMFGAIQNIMSKSSKYSLFDPTKEMAYIPLDQEAKVKGKAAVDVVGARLGKSGGSLIQIVLLTMASLNEVTLIIAGILLFIIGGWIVAARSLNKQFLALTAEGAKVEEKRPIAVNEPVKAAT